MKYWLSTATIISIITYLFWETIKINTGISVFYIGNALFIFMLCFYLYFSDRSNNIKFILVSLSLNNLLDELFFDNTIFQLNELMFLIGVILILLIRIKNDRKFQRVGRTINEFFRKNITSRNNRNSN